MGIFSFGHFDLSLVTPPTGNAPDLPAAAIAWLRATPAVVSAFGEDTSAKATVKFHADKAWQGVRLPWATYVEIDGDVQYMTGAGGVTNTIETGAVRFIVVSEDKKATRDLGRLLTQTLDDAPLVFDDGELMYLRAKKPFFVPVAEVTDNAPSAYALVIIFETVVNRQV